MAEEKQAAPAKADEPAASGGGSKLVVILTLVNLLVSVGVGAVLFISHKKDKQASSVADIQPGAEEHGEAGDLHCDEWRPEPD